MKFYAVYLCEAGINGNVWNHEYFVSESNAIERVKQLESLYDDGFTSVILDEIETED